MGKKSSVHGQLPPTSYAGRPNCSPVRHGVKKGFEGLTLLPAPGMGLVRNAPGTGFMIV